MKLLQILVVFVSAFAGLVSAQKVIYCYHGTWSTYRNSLGKFDVSDINPFLCTHLAYTFFGIEENGDLKVLDPYLDLEDNWGRGNIKQFNLLKKKNPKLKTLAAIGGWNEGSRKYSIVAADSSKRKRFAKSATQFALKHNFDGIDMDWEYPGQRDGNPKVDKANFVLLLKDLKAELSKHNLILSAAVAATESSASISYNIKEISKYLDFINIMTYDLHGSWESTVGINAPLYAGPKDVTEIQKQLNVEASVRYWLKQGAPASKVILGVPLYGRTFTLQDSSKNYVGAPSNGPGAGGQYTNEPGFIGYNEFCEKLNKEKWTLKTENTQKVPYGYKGQQWVGYDDVKSVELKAKLANKLGLRGVMVWSIDTDDFRGVCGKKYPLLSKLNDLVNTEITVPEDIPAMESSSTTAKPEEVPVTESSSTAAKPEEVPVTESSSTTAKPATVNPGSEFICQGNGIFRDPVDCALFYICDNGRRSDFECPSGLYFDVTIMTCNYEEKTQCP